MKKRLIIVAAALASLMAVSCSKKASTGNVVVEQVYVGDFDNTPVAKNVILVIGDGMGLAQVSASIVLAQEENSQFYRFPYAGFSRTYSLDNYTTDSGAGGTAIETGHKVQNHHLALSPNNRPWPSLFHVLYKSQGKSTGFVVTSSVLDATPAASYAHVSDRHMYDQISMQMAKCHHSVMIGGDKEHFLPAKRKDGKAPLDTLAARGYELVYSIDSMMNSKSRKLVAIPYMGNPPSAAKRDNFLEKGTRKAIEILSSNPKGFALLVEGSQIDWAGHNNDTEFMNEELIDFERTLKVILDFAEKDGNTLVVVTADHETGGMALINGNIEKGENEVRYIHGSHTGVMVPVFAYGVGAERFTGVMQNTDICNKILKTCGQSVAE